MSPAAFAYFSAMKARRESFERTIQLVVNQHIAHIERKFDAAFTPAEFERLCVYRGAVRNGFFNEG